MNLEIRALFSVSQTQNEIQFPTDLSATFGFQRKTEQKPEKVFIEVLQKL